MFFPLYMMQYNEGLCLKLLITPPPPCPSLNVKLKLNGRNFVCKGARSTAFLSTDYYIKKPCFYMVEMVNSRQCIYSIILGRLIYYGYCNAFLDANESVGLVLTCYMFALMITGRLAVQCVFCSHSTFLLCCQHLIPPHVRLFGLLILFPVYASSRHRAIKLKICHIFSPSISDFTRFSIDYYLEECKYCGTHHKNRSSPRALVLLLT